MLVSHQKKQSIILLIPMLKYHQKIHLAFDRVFYLSAKSKPLSQTYLDSFFNSMLLADYIKLFTKSHEVM